MFRVSNVCFRVLSMGGRMASDLFQSQTCSKGPADIEKLHLKVRVKSGVGQGEAG